MRAFRKILPSTSVEIQLEMPVGIGAEGAGRQFPPELGRRALGLRRIGPEVRKRRNPDHGRQRGGRARGTVTDGPMKQPVLLQRTILFSLADFLAKWNQARLGFAKPRQMRRASEVRLRQQPSPQHPPVHV